MLFNRLGLLRVIYILALQLLCHVALAQQTLIHYDPGQLYQTGQELFSKEKYASAQAIFEKIIQRERERTSSHTLESDVVINAEYYFALCAVELYRSDAEYLLNNFLQDHPENPRAGSIHFVLGKLYYKQKKYRLAAEWLSKADKYYLTKDEISEYYFKLGYSLFNIGNLDKASKAFYEVRDPMSRFFSPASYYYAHIAYQLKNYETALLGFMKIKDAEGFSALVPYYISQIYYLQGKYASLTEYAAPLLSQKDPQNSLEITRMVGEAYYRQQLFKESIPYLEEYQKNASSSTREDFYQLGYAFYKAGDFAKAAEKFEKLMDGSIPGVSSTEDGLTQTAYYALADCFLRLNRKQNARNAFQLASKMNFDMEIKEDALFSFAKLSYELSVQSAAVDAFQKYIKSYPESPRQDQAKEYLAEIFSTTHNYKDGMAAIEEIKNKTEKIKTAYQKMAYFRGIEMYNDNRSGEAVELFEKSLLYPVDPKLQASATYWKAESYYKQNKYDAAIKSYSDFLYTPSAVGLSNYNLGNYNLGYCYFKKTDYHNAVSWFRKYTKNKEETDSIRYNDATLRVADAFFMQRDHLNAADYYDEAIRNNASASDYALFQRGMIAGIENKMRDKVDYLQKITSQYKNSAYTDDALYEMANALLVLNENQKALALLQQLSGQFPSSSYMSKALLKTALVYFNEKQDAPALENYKKVIQDYPSTPEARAALTGIKNIYVNEGNAEEYIRYAEKIPFANVSKSAQDSITYEAAETRFMKGDCETSLKDFENYLAKFSDGSFVINASFYKAECEFKGKQYDKALIGYSKVLSIPKNTFTETSLLKSATIYYSILSQYEPALKNYIQLEEIAEYKNNRLEALAGEMRCFHLLKQSQKAVEASIKLMSFSEKLSPELLLEAHLTAAKSYLEQDSLEMALKEFSIVAQSGSEMGAEAKCYLATIQYNKGNFKESQQTIFELVNQVPSYGDWVARGFIILSDDYLQLNDAFQAKATLQSIIDNYDGKDNTIVTRCKEKLNAILEKEKEQSATETKDKLNNLPAKSIDE